MLQQGAAIFAVKVQSTTRHHRDRIAGVALLRKHASTTAAGGAQPTVRRCLGTQKHGWCARGGGHIRVPHAFWRAVKGCRTAALGRIRLRSWDPVCIAMAGMQAVISDNS